MVSPSLIGVIDTYGIELIMMALSLYLWLNLVSNLAPKVNSPSTGPSEWIVSAIEILKVNDFSFWRIAG